VMATKESVTDTHRLTSKGRATRERIVATAAQLMYDNGVAATSPGDVQKAAGVGASQMYHYFADKEALIRAVIAHRIQALLATLGGLDSMEGLRAWRDFVVDTQRRRDCAGGCPLGSLVGELAEPFPDCRADLVGGFDQWEAVIREGLQAMWDRGELRRTADPDRLATVLLAAVEGGMLLAQLRRDTAPLKTALDDVLDRIENLRPRRAPAGQ
jgi:TetR/AcrR family transcriptional repressor of nem operon